METGRPALGAALPKRVMTIPVISGPALGIDQHFIGFADLLELLLARLVVRIAVRMIFKGQFAIGLLQLFLVGFRVTPRTS